MAVPVGSIRAVRREGKDGAIAYPPSIHLIIETGKKAKNKITIGKFSGLSSQGKIFAEAHLFMVRIKCVCVISNSGVAAATYFGPKYRRYIGYFSIDVGGGGIVV